MESERMVDYLIDLGHKRIAIIAAETYEECIGRLRLEGYYDALKKHGIASDAKLIFETDEEINHFSMENGYITKNSVRFMRCRTHLQSAHAGRFRRRAFAFPKMSR